MIESINACRMGNFVYIKNWFLASCYKLVAKTGSSLVSDRKVYRKNHSSLRLLDFEVLVYWESQESL